MNWTKHDEKLNGLYKGNRRGMWAVLIGLLIIGAVIIGRPSPAVDVNAVNNCIDGLFAGEYTDTACETCEKLINRQ